MVFPVVMYGSESWTETKEITTGIPITIQLTALKSQYVFIYSI